MAKNDVLLRAATDALDTVRRDAEATGASARRFTETDYRAQSWPHARRVVIKAEVVAHPGKPLRDNPRFVVTNLRHAPATVYTEIYTARGDSENRLKELHHDLAFGRTSCSRFWANQLRVLLSAAARAAPRPAAPRRAPSPARRRAACASRCSRSACTSCAPCVASSSTSRARIRISRPGARLRAASAPSPADRATPTRRHFRISVVAHAS